MATLIKADGTCEPLIPPYGLKRLQSLVGGYIEYVYLDERQIMVCDEEGKLKHKPINTKATEIFEKLKGPYDIIVGDVVMGDLSEIEGDSE